MGNLVDDAVKNAFGKRFKDANLCSPPMNTSQKAAMDICKKFYMTKSIYLTGPYGTGKTFLLCAIYRALCMNKIRTKVFMIKELQDYLRNLELDGDLSHKVKSLRKDYDAFIVDDLDKIKISESFDNNFFVFVDYIYQEEKILHVSSNKNFKELISFRFNGATVRRLQDLSQVIDMA